MDGQKVKTSEILKTTFKDDTIEFENVKYFARTIRPYRLLIKTPIAEIYIYRNQRMMSWHDSYKNILVKIVEITKPQNLRRHYRRTGVKTFREAVMITVAHYRELKNKYSEYVN